MRKFHLVIAASLPEFGIGANGTIPWHLKEDIKYFKQLTINTKDENKQNAVIMGRKTWESIPTKFRPLSKRLNIVLTRNTKSDLANEIKKNDNTLVLSSFDQALECLDWSPYLNTIESIYIIGGSQLYNQSLLPKYINNLQSIYLTKIFIPIKCDTFFKFDESLFNTNILGNKNKSESNPELEYQLCQLIPKPQPQPQQQQQQELSNQNEKGNTTEKEIEQKINETNKENNSSNSNQLNSNDTISTQKTEIEQKTDESSKSSIPSNVSTSGNTSNLSHVNEDIHSEYQYLNLISHIINFGISRSDRTGTGTKSIFGATMRFNLRNNEFPLLTTKRVFWRGVAQELLWFVNGCTDAKELQNKKIHIWDGNGSREFLDSRGLKHYETGDLGPVYGFQWRHFGAKYIDCHTDYTGKGVDQLMNVINTIKNNPYSRRIIMSAWNPADLDKMALPPCHMFCQFYVANGELSCQMYQRSADMGLGVPFNIASYSLLLKMIAQVCDLTCGDFVHVIGDCHVYLNHIEPLKEQLKRKPKKFPILKLNPNKHKIDDFVYEDFKIDGYKPHKTIKMKMAV